MGIHCLGKLGLCPDEIIFTQHFHVLFQQGALVRKPCCKVSQNFILLISFIIFEGENLIVHLNCFFRLNERCAPGITFPMKDSFDNSFVFCINSEHPSAIQERLFNIGYVTGFLQLAEHPVKGPALLISFSVKRHADPGKIHRGSIHHPAIIPNDAVYFFWYGFFKTGLVDDLVQGTVIACSFIIKPTKNAFDVFGQVSEQFKNITAQYGPRNRQKFQFPRQVKGLIVLKGLSCRHDLQILVRLSKLKIDELFTGMDP